MQLAVHVVMAVTGGTIYCILHCRVQYTVYCIVGYNIRIMYCMKKHCHSQLCRTIAAPDVSGLCEAWVEWSSEQGGGGFRGAEMLDLC